MAETETIIKQIAEKLDTLSPKQLDEVKHYSEYLLSTQEQRTKEKHLQYVSVLRGAVSCFERMRCSMEDSNAALLYEIYCEKLLQAMDLIRLDADGVEFDNSLDYGKIRYILQCLIRSHKLTYYGTECNHVCRLDADLDGVPCEICEERKCPKEEIENDLYLKALAHVLRLLNLRGL